MTIDWTGELEAYHVDGRVVAVALDKRRPQPDKRDLYSLMHESGEAIDNHWYFDVDGNINDGWRIRNATKPSTPSNEELTQRMEKLVRLLAECEPCGENEGEIAMIAIAKAIVSDLPKPVDPDNALAESIADDIAEGATSFSHHDLMMAALDGIRAGRGRTLAAGGTAHE